ncbi:cytochrome d ubiquinol oxidase subunit II [Pontibacter silvestris]|uniref:Cytochrome d ubiquinol oxidase subunit II n=1 Tax=Pontibacter silvestris TaxID=2305183 RepID=A0ABW4WSJ6_9BACT|nr:cytochrome d ubiquinol oxidase subunit II [Pontibacter silvestris]MCC9137799.1 cytochrome d ubiquinol oxidase subunit II [Pontibacter silvestris]
MLQIIIIILGVSFILYTLLGGADFGAGIVETFAGKEGEKTISKAIAPVWEANHVWLILAIVIIFTGFPQVYSTISVSLHIPLMVVLIGIVLRGSSFTFRHYDVADDNTHKYYTAFFKVSSFITPVFLGITLGAMILGNITLSNSGSFYEQFIRPWFNVFCLVMGLFSASLFGYIAAVFLIGEARHSTEQKRYISLSKIFLLLTFVMGVLVFAAAEFENHNLFNEFFKSRLSITAFSLVVLLIPVVFYLFNHPNIAYLRAAISLQVALIMFGWFAIQFPILVYEKNGNHLTFYNTQAPYATLYQLLIALFVGLVLVIPAFYFLFKVFKKSNGQNVNP